MLSSHFDVLRALSEYTHTDKWNLDLFYTLFLLSLTHDVIRVYTFESESRPDNQGFRRPWIV